MSLALLLGLPVSEAQFGQCLATSDFLRGNTHLADWQTYYAAVASRVLELDSCAEQCGFAVFSAARLADVTRATQKYATVVVLSHWKGPDFQEDDLLENDVSLYLDRLKNGGAPAVELARRELSALASPCRNDLLSVLSRALNCESAIEAEMSRDGDVANCDFTRSCFVRDELDDLFEGVMRPGNRIELADGMHSKEVFAKAVAPCFAGMLDLTTCTSSHLGSYLGRIARGRYLSIHFEQPLNVRDACLLLSYAFRLHASGMDYFAARCKAMLDFVEILKQIATRRGNAGG
jgi:hypothetical protein